MKANDLTIKDLMIGDWVYNTHNRQNERVQEIGSGLVMLDYNDLYEYDEIEPVPITPEILEKNGFEKIEAKYYRYFLEEKDYYESVSVYFDEEANVQVRVLDGSEFKGRIKYIHELQQAMRLCGIKGKEIEL